MKNRGVIVHDTHRNFVAIRLIGTNSANNTFCTPRTNFLFQPARCPWAVDRRQSPLRLAYAITFYSCQGLTLDKVVLVLHSDVFAHDQLYTAISRVRNRTCIRRLMPGRTPNGSRSTTNIVHKELLLGAQDLWFGRGRNK